MQAFFKFFSAPVYLDEEINRRAGLLSFILNLHIVVALGTTLVFVLFLQMPPIFPLAAFLSSLPGFGLRALMWRGYVRQASVLFVSMVVLIMPLTAWFSGYSVAIVTVTVFQCITVLMAGLLLGGWGAAIFVASTGAINGILIYAELHGKYVTNPTHQPILSWFMQLVAFGAIASMLYVTNRIIRESFARAQKENDQRRAREQELEQVVREKTQAEAALQKIAERLEILHDIDRSLLSVSSSQEITQKALARIRQLVPCLRASVTLFNFDKNEAIFLAADFERPSTGSESVISLQEYGQYIITELQQNKPCFVNDTRTHPSATELDQHLAQNGLSSWLYLPLLYQGQLIGALNLGRAAENFFTAEEAEIAFGVANQLAVVIRQTRLYEALQNELTERKQTEEKLVNSEARLRALVENSPGLILEVNRQGEILFINRYSEIYVGRNIRNFLSSNQIDSALQIMDKAFETGEFQAAELQTVNPSGQITWDSIRVGPVKQGDLVTSLTIIMTDITIKKQAEVVLRRSESIYRQAITTAGAVPYYRDRRTNTYTFMGEGILAMTGYSASEMTPELWETLEQEGFPRGALAHLSYAEADRITNEDPSLLWECDYRIRTRDGQTRWVADSSVKEFNEYGEQVGVIGILQDITERKQTEEKIRRSSNQLAVTNEIGRAVSALSDLNITIQTIFEQITKIIELDVFFIALYDASQNRVTYPIMYDSGQFWDEEPTALSDMSWTARAIQSRQPILTNRSEAEIKTQKPSKVLGSKRISASAMTVPMIVGDKILGVVAVHSYELNAYNNEHLKLLEGVTLQVAIALENARLYASLQQELTGRKQAEAERESFIQELEAKNAELERFNYTVSHELKSPIVTIKGFLGSIAKDIHDEKYERAQKDLQRISNATDKMYDTLSDLLELSRIGRIRNPPEEVDLVELTKEALETVHGRIQSRNIIVDIAPDLPAIYGDRARLREVYENLIDNAAKHFGDQPAPRIEIGVRKDGNESVLFVKDNGMGIDEKYHKRIFGLFDKLDATSEGTGIGLALVKRIIETHGGRIWVESEGSGKGSTFCFTIPDIKKAAD